MSNEPHNQPPQQSVAPDGCEFLEHMPYAVDEGIGARARIGVVVLATDYTIEHEFRAVMTPLPGVDFYAARIPSSLTVNPENLAAMGPHITKTVDLILTPGDVQVVAYGCTSASTVMGVEEIARCIHESRPGVSATNPVRAAFTALRALKARKIAILTPYARDVNVIVRQYFLDGGFEIPVFGTFNIDHDPTSAAIDVPSLKRAVHAIAEGRDIDAVFVSCTNIRLVEAVEELEAELGMPVTSSNHALAWHCLRLSGVNDRIDGLGKLYQLDA
jgi:maleate isomerase